jgi:hypothetical protein
LNNVILKDKNKNKNKSNGKKYMSQPGLNINPATMKIMKSLNKFNKEV